MTTFDDRENAFENKFAHDEEMRFRAIARRDRKAGLWAAGLLGKTGAEADAYADEVIRSNFQRPGDDDIEQKLFDDLGGKLEVSQIRERMAALLVEAQRELMQDAAARGGAA